MLEYCFVDKFPSRAKMKEHLKKNEGNKKINDGLEGFRMLTNLAVNAMGGI